MVAVGHSAFGGSLAILDILRYEIKSLYITGFPCLYTPEGAPQDLPLMSFKNLDWLRRLHESYETIEVDRNMQRLFEIVPREYDEEC